MFQILMLTLRIQQFQTNFLRNCVILSQLSFIFNRHIKKGHRGRDRMVVGFTITCAISAYHH
jgi:hypothetical protein